MRALGRVSPEPMEETKEPQNARVVKPGFLHRISIATNQAIEGAFLRLGSNISRRPWTWLIVMTALALISMAGFSNLKMEEDQNNLYTPQSASAFKDEEFVNAVYKEGRGDQQVKLFLLPKGSDGQNILTKANLLDFMNLYNNIATATVTYEGVATVLTDVCAKFVLRGSSRCKVSSVLSAWNYSAQALAADPDVLATLNSNASLDYNGRPNNLNYLLGGAQRVSGRVVSAEVFQLILTLEFNSTLADGTRRDPLMREWEDRILQIAFDEYDSDLLTCYVYNGAAVSRESSAAINKDVMLLTIGYILLIAYTAIALWRNSRVYQKFHLTAGSVAAIALGGAAAFGIVAGLGMPFNFTIQVLPFLLIGLGVDDTFIIIGAYMQQPPGAPAEAKVAAALASAGASITVTSLTDLIAFCIGTWTDLPALQAFSVYAAIGILLVYIYQCTFFVACLALDARREERARSRPAPTSCFARLKCCTGCAWCCSDTRDLETPAPLPPASCCGPPTVIISQGRAVAHEPSRHMAMTMTDLSGAPGPVGTPHTTAPTQSSMQADPSTGKVNAHGISGDVDLTMVVSVAPAAGHKGEEADYSSERCCWGTRRFHPHEEQLSSILVGRWLPAIILTWWGKAVVLALEAGLLAAAIYGCTQVYQDFRFREWFVPKDSWLHDAYAVENKYFGGEQTPFAVYTKTAPDGGSYAPYTSQLAAVPRALAASTYVTDVPAISSWFTDFSTYLQSNATTAPLLVSGTAPSATAFDAWLRDWLDGPGYYRNPDIKFAANGSIISTRISAFSRAVVDGSWAVRYLKSVRNVARETAPDLDAFAFGPPFLFYDGFSVITNETIRNVISAGVAVFVVVLLLLASIPASLLVGGMVVACDVCLFGFMHYVGLTFNSVTAIVLVLAVGISVDYAAHICRAFLVQPGTDRTERMRGAMRNIGGEVLNGAFTTWLAIVAMAGAKHYIFQTFFKLFFALIVLAVWHGIVLLPVLLTFVGPATLAL